MDNTLKARFNELNSDKTMAITRAEKLAAMVMPRIFTEDTQDEARLEQPWCNVPQEGVATLSAKILMTLLPPNTAYWNLLISEPQAQQQIEIEGKKAEADDLLNKISDAMLLELNKTKIRALVVRLLRLLLVTGNGLLALFREGERVYNLKQYVVVRDPAGTVTEVITLDKISPKTLPPEHFSKLADNARESKHVHLYTRAVLNDSREWILSQECEGIELNTKTLPFDSNPFVVLTWSLIEGEHYGRAFVEDYLGDINTANTLSKATDEAAALMARYLLLKRPGSVLNSKALAEATNGAVLSGNPGDLEVLQAGKQADLSVTVGRLKDVERRLQVAFRSTAGITRDAERVTAEEIRRMAQDLEENLAEPYTLLGQELQGPIAREMYKRATIALGLQDFSTLVDIRVVTGMEGLARGHDIAKLDQLVMRMQSNPELSQHVNKEELVKRYVTGLGIQAKNLLITAEQLAQQAQQAQMNELLSKAASPVANNLTKGTNG